MWFRKKTPVENSDGASAPPPWENIDTVPKREHAQRMRFNLTQYVVYGTGFSPRGAKLLLFGFAVAICFIAYVIYMTSLQGPPLPRDVSRPAIDQYASTTRI